eukprot:4857505-Alexandrium_andersonii.AAC.1
MPDQPLSAKLGAPCSGESPSLCGNPLGWHCALGSSDRPRLRASGMSRHWSRAQNSSGVKFSPSPKLGGGANSIWQQ